MHTLDELIAQHSTLTDSQYVERMKQITQSHLIARVEKWVNHETYIADREARAYYGNA